MKHIKYLFAFLAFLLYSGDVKPQNGTEIHIDFKYNNFDNAIIDIVLESKHKPLDTVYSGILADTVVHTGSLKPYERAFVIIQYGSKRPRTNYTNIALDSSSVLEKLIFHPYLYPNQKECDFHIQSYFRAEGIIDIRQIYEFEVGDHPAFKIRNLSDSAIYNYTSKNAFNGILELPTGQIYEGNINSLWKRRHRHMETIISEYQLLPGKETFGIVGEYDPYKFGTVGKYKYELIYSFQDNDDPIVNKTKGVKWIKWQKRLYRTTFEFNVNEK